MNEKFYVLILKLGILIIAIIYFSILIKLLVNSKI